MDIIGIERMRFEPERPASRLPRRGGLALAGVLLLLGSGAVSVAAVNVLRWRDSVNDARLVASDRNASDRALTDASTVLHRHAQEAVEELLRIEARGGDAAQHASIFLRKINAQTQR